MSRPQTVEGRQVWDLVMRIGHQLRICDGAVVGFDFTAVLALAGAMGVNPAAVAEWLPAIETIAVQEMNKTLRDMTMTDYADG
jgi:hypothetical protein